MKSIKISKSVLLSLFLLSSSILANELYKVNELKELPKYSKKLQLVSGSCSCTDGGNQTCKSSDCSCSSDFFGCNCSECANFPVQVASNGTIQYETLGHIHGEVSMSEQQYENVWMLHSYFKNLPDGNGVATANIIASMVSSLETKDYQNYGRLSHEFKTKVSGFSDVEKKEFREFLRANDASPDFL